MKDIKIHERPIEHRVTLDFSKDQGRTHQEFTADADINNIMKRYLATGVIPHVAKGQPFYGDFTEATDFQDCLTRVEEATDAFMRLPSSVRSLCENDPANLLAMLGTEQGTNDLVDAGLALQLELPPEGTEGEAPPQEAPSGPPANQPPGGGTEGETTS